MSKEKFLVCGINRHRMQTDGRGITTLVALFGCPLSCRYCINEEMLQDREHVKLISPEALAEQLAIDHCYFIYTDGGVTFGGGEPLLQSEALLAFARVCPPEWNITIETSLNVPAEQLMPLLSGRFSFIADVKAMQPEIYRCYTGAENGQVRENLKLLRSSLPDRNYVIKLPAIPGYTSSKERKDAIAQLKELGITEEHIAVFSYVNTKK